MKLNDKNIDQLFRDAAQNSGAPRYDSAYWKEMNATLDAEDKRKKGFLLWSIAGSFLSAILVFALFIVNNSTKSESLMVAANNQAATFISKDGNHINHNQTEKQHEGNDFEQNDKPDKHLNENKTNSKFASQNNALSSKKSSEVNDNEALNSIQNKRSAIDAERKNISIVKNTDIINGVENSIFSLSAKSIDFENKKVPTQLIFSELKGNSSITYYAKISAGLMENYETSRPFQSGIFDISFNLAYKKNQVLFRTGLGFQMTSNADLVVSERAKVYGFGLTTFQNNLSYQSLYDLYIPLEVGYNLNKTSFGFGTQLNYMVSTSMNLESLENNILVSEEKLKGFKDGLNSFTAQGYVWLEQSISKRFAAGIKVGTNLNSRIKEGRFFNESNTTNPLYGQLTLKFNLSK